MKTILEEANEIVAGSRQQDYGDAVESFKKIAQIASVTTGKDLTASDCCKVLMALKDVRQSNKHKRDNLVDACGYREILYRIEESEKKLYVTENAVIKNYEVTHEELNFIVNQKDGINNYKL